MVLFAAFCFLFRAPLLRGAAQAWIINDPVTNADAIVILGGGLEYRPFAAAQIYSNLVHRTSAISASQPFSSCPGPLDYDTTRLQDHRTGELLPLRSGAPLVI